MTKKVKKLYDYAKEFDSPNDRGFTKKISNYIEGELGGAVSLYNDNNAGYVAIRWKRFDEKSHEVLYFMQKFSFQELEAVVNPETIAQKFVELYKRDKEAKKNE